MSGNYGKIPPNDQEVEMLVIGSCLSSPSALIVAESLISKDSFYNMQNAYIWEAIHQLSVDGKQVDLLTVQDQLRKSGYLDLSGGARYINLLTNKITSASNLEMHCFILKEKQMKRMQINLGVSLTDKGYNDKDDPFDVNEFLSDEAYKIQNIGNISADVSNDDLAQELIQRIEKASQSMGITGVPTGFYEVDKLFGGLQAPDLIVLAARPAMGKTALALIFFLNMVIIHNKTAVFFSLEMSAQQLFQRLCSMHMNIPADKFKTGSLSDQDWQIFNAKLGEILSDRLIIVDDCYSASDIKNKVKQLRLKKQIDCVFVDYLQICEGKGGNREQEISNISRSFKMMAKEINAPVIALSQLSRKVDERGDKRPKLSDLRESGAIEQDADVVTFLYRPSYYGEDDDVGAAYLIVSKNRNGALKDIRMHYAHDRTLFTDGEEGRI